MSVASSDAKASDYCLRPVPGSEARLEIEKQQPYRIAQDPKEVPGFDGLVVKARNRHELYEFDGRRLKWIVDEFPHVWGFAYEHGIHVTPMGHAYGFGSRPRVIFYLQAETHNWVPIETTRNYNRAFFDQGNGDAYVHMKEDGQIFRLRGGHQSSDITLPIWNDMQTKSIRTIPEIAGVLALTGPLNGGYSGSNSIWFKPTGGSWDKIETPLPAGHRLLDTLHDATIEVQGDLVRVFPENSHYEPMFFRMERGKLLYAGSAPRGRWHYHPTSKTWIAWTGDWIQPMTTTRYWVFHFARDPIPPIAFVLHRGHTAAQVISGLSPASSVSKQTISYSPWIDIPGDGWPVFVRSANGLATFDGHVVSYLDHLTYENIGRLPRVLSFPDLVLIQSEKGIFILNDDMSTERINSFPSQEPLSINVSIDFIPAWQRYVIVDRRSGLVFLSSDMRVFTPLTAPVKLTEFIGVHPDQTSALFVGESQLYALTYTCG